MHVQYRYKYNHVNWSTACKVHVFLASSVLFALMYSYSYAV